jgi:hypothetical protein
MLHKLLITRAPGIVHLATLLASLLLAASCFLPAPSAAAGERAPRSPVSAEKKAFSAEESRALGDAAQRRDEARQQVWDRKMKAMSKSICTGC